MEQSNWVSKELWPFSCMVYMYILIQSSVCFGDQSKMIHWDILLMLSESKSVFQKIVEVLISHLRKKNKKTKNWNFLKAYYALCKCPSLFESLKYCEWLFKIISKPSRLLSLGAGISPQFVENTSLIRSLGVMLHQMVWFLPGKLWPNVQERRNEIIKACWWIDFCLQFPDKRTTLEISIKPLVFFSFRVREGK